MALNAKKIIEGKPEFEGKKKVLIIDNSIWIIVIPDNYIENNFYYT